MMHEERYQRDPQFKAANDIYSLYFIGWILGVLAFVIGGIWAQYNTSRTHGIVSSHFRFQVSMAVQGCLVSCVIVLFVLCGQWLNLSMMWAITTLIVVAYIWWWLWRSIAGYRILAQQQAVANPKTWGKPHTK